MRTVLTLILLLLFTKISAQEKPDYLRYPTIPIFTLLSPDSTQFTQQQLAKNKRLLIMIFSPDCHYCREETKSIIDHMEKLKDIQILMTTFEPLQAMTAYYKEFNLQQYANIKMGRDTRYFFPPFYNITKIPFMALYNEKGQLLTTFETNVPITTLLQSFKL